VTGSLSIGLSAIAALVVLGGLAVLLGVPANSLREKAQRN
jgi:ACS family phthalate transporter-like MFS transporter